MRARICIFAALLLAQGCTKRGVSAELAEPEAVAEQPAVEPSSEAEEPPEPAEGQTQIGVLGVLEGDEILEQNLVGGLEALEGGGAPQAMRVESLAEVRAREEALPQVRIEALEIEGLDAEPAERSLRARLVTVARCAALAMERGEAIELRPRLLLQVDASGKVEGVTLEGVAQPQLHRCIEQAAARWRFHTGAGGQLHARLLLGVPESP